MKNIPFINIALAGGIAFAGYKILQKLGLLPTAVEIREKRSVQTSEGATQSANPFSINMRLPSGAWLLKAKDAAKLADSIYRAHSWYNDNEEAIYGVFRKLQTQSQVSSLSKAFQAKYKEDLYYWLKNILSAGELATVLKIVNAKPKFKA